MKYFLCYHPSTAIIVLLCQLVILITVSATFKRILSTEMMSGAEDLEKEGTADMCCASCGIAEVDDVTLQKCDDCDLVRYCSDKCQQDHRPDHEAMCKERAAVLRDELLFRQPESTHLGDCPICCLPRMPPSCRNSPCLGVAANLSVRDVKLLIWYVSGKRTCPMHAHSVDSLYQRRARARTSIGKE